MTKAEIISRISEKTGVEKTTALVVVESLMLEIKDSIRQNESVFLRGFGTFSLEKERKKLEGTFQKIQLLLYLNITSQLFSSLKIFKEEVKTMSNNTLDY